MAARSTAPWGRRRGDCWRPRWSARAYTRILKIARTIADLEGEASLTLPHVAEAVQYCSLDRQFSSPQGGKFAKEAGERYLV